MAAENNADTVEICNMLVLHIYECKSAARVMLVYDLKNCTAIHLIIRSTTVEIIMGIISGEIAEVVYCTLSNLTEI